MGRPSVRAVGWAAVVIVAACSHPRPAPPAGPPATAPSADAPPDGAPPIAIENGKAAPVCGTHDTDALASFNRGVDAYDHGDADAAIAAYQEAIARDPDFCDALDNLAVVLRRLDRLDEAIALYERSLALAPHNQFALQNVGVAYRMAHREADAMRSYQRLTELSPTNPEGWFGVAQVALIAKQAHDAWTAARRAEELYVAAGSPLVDDARLLAGLAAIPLHDWAEVRRTLEPQHARLLGDAAANLALGEAFLQPDALDKERARRYLARARELGATVPDALWQRAQ